jgi:deoxyadenosine/deoxycytidine kinase
MQTNDERTSESGYSDMPSLIDMTEEISPPPFTRPRLISLEGNIGAGKSTFIEHMKSVFQDDEEIVFIQEPVDIWEKIKQNGKTMIELFYENPKKYAFSFQVMAFTTRQNLIRNAIMEAVQPDSKIKTIVMERSLEADRNIFAQMLHDEGQLEPCEFEVYKMMSEVGLFECSVDGIMWLTTEPEECERRIRNRGRDGEQDISLQYLEKCGLYHRQWLISDLDWAFRIDDDKFVGSTAPIDENSEEIPAPGEPLDWNSLRQFILG